MEQQNNSLKERIERRSKSKRTVKFTPMKTKKTGIGLIWKSKQRRVILIIFEKKIILNKIFLKIEIEP